MKVIFVLYMMCGEVGRVAIKDFGQALRFENQVTVELVEEYKDREKLLLFIDGKECI